MCLCYTVSCFHGKCVDCPRETKYTIWNKTHISGVQQMYVVFIVEQKDATCITYYILLI
jgi:hypothetical protein